MFCNAQLHFDIDEFLASFVNCQKFIDVNLMLSVFKNEQHTRHTRNLGTEQTQLTRVPIAQLEISTLPLPRKVWAEVSFKDKSKHLARAKTTNTTLIAHVLSVRPNLKQWRYLQILLAACA